MLRLIALLCGITMSGSFIASRIIIAGRFDEFRVFAEAEASRASPLGCLREYLIDVDLEETSTPALPSSRTVTICDFSHGVVIEIHRERFVVWRRSNGHTDFTEAPDAATAIRQIVGPDTPRLFYLAADRSAPRDSTTSIIQQLSSLPEARVFWVHSRRYRDTSSLPLNHPLWLHFRSSSDHNQWKDGPQYLLAGKAAADWYEDHVAFCPQIARWIRPDWFDRGPGPAQTLGSVLSSLFSTVEACDRDVDYEALRIMLHQLFSAATYSADEVTTHQARHGGVGP